MSAKKKFSLGIVTENQKRVQKAETLAALLVDYLPNIRNFHLEKYSKFPNSYRIELEGDFTDSTKLVSESIEITDSMASPWLVFYDRDSGNIELIFNKTESSRFEHNEFHVIRWAHFQVM